MAVCDSHFRRFVLFQAVKKEHRCMAIVATSQPKHSFKGQAAQQTEHREAMTKQEGTRQIKLACI